MTQPGVLICDMPGACAAALAEGFERLGWNVQTTRDDAVAGYRLLMWIEPEQLPQIAVFNWDDPRDLLDFCAVLKDQEVLDHVRVIVILDEPEAALAFQRLGVSLVQTSTDPWVAVKAEVARIAETCAACWPGFSPATQTLRADLHASLNHQHADQPIAPVAQGHLPARVPNSL